LDSSPIPSLILWKGFHEGDGKEHERERRGRGEEREEGGKRDSAGQCES